jgi:two-component system cell cycle response regulator CpdR
MMPWGPMQPQRHHNPANTRILVADDEPPVREFVTRALQSAGYTVTVAADGAAALQKLQAETFELLISDIMMPELDGIALALKVAKDYPQTKIMLISGYAMERARAHNLESLIHHIMPKPFTLQELLDVVTNMLDR